MTLTTDTTNTTTTTDPIEVIPDTPPRRPFRHTLEWAIVAFALTAAAILGIVALMSDSSSSPRTTPAPSRPQGLPFTADAAEHWLADDQPSARPEGLPTSADAAERWLLKANRSN